MLAQPIVAEHAERLVEHGRDVLELARQLPAQIGGKRVGREVTARGLVGATNLEAGGVTAHAEQREVIRIGDELPARANALARRRSRFSR